MSIIINIQGGPEILIHALGVSSPCKKEMSHVHKCLVYELLSKDYIQRLGFEVQSIQLVDPINCPIAITMTL